MSKTAREQSATATGDDKEAKENGGQQGQEGGSARVQSGAQISHGEQGLPMPRVPTSPFDAQKAEGQQDNTGVGFPLGSTLPCASSPFLLQ